MRRSRRVVSNAVWSVLQVVANGGLYLILYRYLYLSVGVEQLGVWSLVMGWASVNGVASLGLSGGALYFVPKYLARGDRAHVVEIVQTATLATAGLIALGLVGFYPLVRLVLVGLIASPELLGLAVDILPVAFAAMWVSTTAAVVYSSVDGFQRVDIRNRVLILGAAVFLGAALVLVPLYGLVGLAAAQLVQAATVLVVSWAALRHLLPEMPLVPTRWSRQAFGEMVGYSVRFQAVAVAQLLFEPLTKSLLTVFGSVSATGFFEMANRLAVQLRALIVTAHMALVPTLTDIGERTPGLLRGIYDASCRVMAFLLVLLLPLLVALTPALGRVWLGAAEPAFVAFAMLLFVGWFGTLFGNPAYVGFMGEGELRWIVRAHVGIAVLNAVLGAGLGAVLGGEGVVLGFVVALLAGNAFVTLTYNRRHGFTLGAWTAPETAGLAAGALAAGAAVLLAGWWAGPVLPAGLHLAAGAALYAALVAAPAWRHSLRLQMLGWVARARRSPTP